MNHDLTSRPLDLLRLTLAALIGAHGWARLLGDGVEPFGKWLNSEGIPLGHETAIAITGLEVAGSALFAVRKMVFPLSLLFSTLYLMGILMLHRKFGWWVVGRGRNGSEYSVLLIAALLTVGLDELGSD